MIFTVNRKRNFHFLNFYISIIIFLILFFISGFKIFGPGNDYDSYYSMVVFKDYVLEYKEIFLGLIIFLNDILFNSNITTFFLIFAIIGLSLKFIAFYKLSQYPYLTILIYFLSYYWLHEYIQIRAGVATGLFLLATKDLSDGKKWNYLIKSFFAILFHWSSIILIPLYFIRKINLKFIIILPLVGILLYFLKFDIEGLIIYYLSLLGIDLTYYNLYAGYKDQINVFNFIAISYILIYIIITSLIMVNNKIFTKYEIILYKLFSFGIFIFYVMSKLNSPVVAFRLQEYFNVVLLILLPSIINKFKQKYIVASIIVAYFCLYFYFLMSKVIVFS
jgi:hypothetical protein